MLWIDRYQPQALSGVIGHSSTVETIAKWADAWENGDKQKPLLLHGPTGSGKTAMALALARERDWDLLEMNASDVRDAKTIDRIAGMASGSATLSGKRRLILFDEIDGLYRADRGGAAAVLKIIKSTEHPVMLTANDIWDKKLSTIRNACQKIEVKKIHHSTIAELLAKISKREGVKASDSVLGKIAKAAEGDVRSAINDLQLLAEGARELKEVDVELLGARDKEEKMFNAVKAVLKATDFKTARESIQALNEEPDFILKWMAENVPKEYTKPEDLYNAYEAISRADVFLGRIFRGQHYEFYRYASDLMSAGIALSKQHAYPGFVRYEFPKHILYLSGAKSDRKLRREIAQKIGAQCHVSASTAVQDYLPLFAELMKDADRAARLTAQFEFTEDELEFMGITDPEGMLEKAEQVKADYLNPKKQAAMDNNQTSLFSFG